MSKQTVLSLCDQSEAMMAVGWTHSALKTLADAVRELSNDDHNLPLSESVAKICESVNTAVMRNHITPTMAKDIYEALGYKFEFTSSSMIVTASDPQKAQKDDPV